MDVIRAGLDMPLRRWKVSLAVFALLALLALAIDGVYTVSAVARGTEGRIGIKTTEVFHLGHSASQVTSIEPWSKAGELGIVPGDVLVLDRWTWIGYRFPGEVIDLTVVHAGEARRVALPTVGRALVTSDTIMHVANALVCLVGVVFGWVVGTRQPRQMTSRALALAFIWWSINVNPGDFVPAGGVELVLRVAFAAALLPGWTLALWFAVNYPDEAPTGLRAGLQRLMPAFVAATVVGVVLAVLHESGYGTTWSRTYIVAFVGVAGLAMLVAFAEGWWRADGELRQRFAWLLGTFCVFYLASYQTYLNWTLEWLSPQVAFVIAVIGTLVMYAGLMYAVLRHRVLDFGLAVNRSLVYGVVGALVIVTFQLLQVLVGRVLHFDDPTRAGLVSGVLALVVFLSVPRVKPAVEWVVDRLFFSRRSAREAELKRFAANAPGFTQPQALESALLAAVARFTGRKACAVFVRDGEGRYACDSPGADSAPPPLAADDPAVVALRAGRPYARPDEVASALPGEMVFALGRPQGLEALVWVGPDPHGAVLRGDEIDALSTAFTDVGAAWLALRWQELRRALEPR